MLSEMDSDALEDTAYDAGWVPSCRRENDVDESCELTHLRDLHLDAERNDHVGAGHCLAQGCNRRKKAGQ